MSVKHMNVSDSFRHYEPSVSPNISSLISVENSISMFDSYTAKSLWRCPVNSRDTFISPLIYELAIYKVSVLNSVSGSSFKSVSGRSCDRPPRHRFRLVSLCLKANAEMVSAFPSCLYMLLM
jgi:hypothetical protein